VLMRYILMVILYVTDLVRGRKYATGFH